MEAYKDYIKKEHRGPGWVAWLVGVSSHALKGRGFDSRSGHTPGLRVQSWSGGAQEATDGCFSLTSMLLSLSLPLSLVSITVASGEDLKSRNSISLGRKKPSSNVSHPSPWLLMSSVPSPAVEGHLKSAVAD